MKALLIPIWIIALCLLFITGVEIFHLQAGYNNSYSNSKIEQTHFKSMPELPVTAITFKNQAYDFGAIPDNKKVYTQFEFSNTGKEPLVILGAEGSCGCTVPTWPKEPIAPGKSAAIEIAFDPNGKSGEHSKIVTITANTKPVTTILSIKATIVKGD